MNGYATKTLKVIGWAVLGWIVGSVVSNVLGFLAFKDVAVEDAMVMSEIVMGVSIALFAWYGIYRIRRQPV
jgi:hypothetical protein